MACINFINFVSFAGHLAGAGTLIDDSQETSNDRPPDSPPNPGP